METNETTSEGLYKQVSGLIDDWLEIHTGETFDLDLVCKQLEITSREGRKMAAIKLAYEVKQGKLEKNNRLYRYIDNTFKLIRWNEITDVNTLDLRWPYGHDDDSRFGFDGHAQISPGDIVVIAGVTNTGKSAFSLDFLWQNMDEYPCTLMVNEYSPSKFKRRVSRMAWAKPLRQDGTPKFELIERHDSWQDIIRPDNVNIIDWINLSDNFYQIGKIIEGIQAKLRNGICLICLQKDPNKPLGMGGGFSEHLASLYLILDFERLTVKKCKEWNGHDPNNETYGFSIVEYGTQFHNIHKVKKCSKCYGTGKSKGGECEICLGSGFTDE